MPNEKYESKKPHVNVGRIGDKKPSVALLLFAAIGVDFDELVRASKNNENPFDLSPLTAPEEHTKEIQ